MTDAQVKEKLEMISKIAANQLTAQEILYLRMTVDSSSAEIAELIHVSRQRIEKVLGKAREKLRMQGIVL